MRTLIQITQFTVACAMAIVPKLSFAATNDSTLSAEATPLSQDSFVTSVANDLAAHFNMEGELQVELLRTWTPPDRIARSWQIQISEYPALPSSSMLVHCRVVADGATATDGTLLLKASLWKDVWVVHQPIYTGSSFNKTLLEVHRVDTFRERDVVPASVGDDTFVFLRSVPVGHFLTWHDIGRRPLVRKGDLVEVTASEGSLSLSMKALAMQNGAQGEAVTVRNVESHKDFTAIVIEENHVQIRF